MSPTAAINISCSVGSKKGILLTDELESAVGLGVLVSYQQIRDGLGEPSRRDSSWDSWSWPLTPCFEQRDSGSAEVHETETAEDGVSEDQGKR